MRTATQRTGRWVAVAGTTLILGLAGCVASPQDRAAIDRWANGPLTDARDLLDPRPQLDAAARRAGRLQRSTERVVGDELQRSSRALEKNQQRLADAPDLLTRRANRLETSLLRTTDQALERAADLAATRTLPWTVDPIDVEISRRVQRLERAPEILGLEPPWFPHPSDPERYTGADAPPPPVSLFTRILTRMPL